MPDPATLQHALCVDADAQERAGRLAQAIELYRRAVLTDRSNPTPYLYLGHALWRGGERDRALACWSLGADLDARVVDAWRNPQVDPAIRARSQQADRALRAHFTALHRDAVAAVQSERPQAALERISEAVWCLTHDAAFDFRTPLQRPHVFYVPALAPVAVFSVDDITGGAALEAATDAIREEYLALASRDDAEPRPYLAARDARLGADWQPLAGTLNWASYHLYRRGEPQPDNLAHCPQTAALLDALPLLCVGPHPREVLFSVLAPGQEIPPHYGLANTDATVHLPLVTNDDCGIRVADETYGWQAGRLFAFDDSFEHASWNRSGEVRVNLLFEAWHPDLSDDERAAVAATFAARERWNASRRI